VIKTLLVGFWACAVALGGSYLATQMANSAGDRDEAATSQDTAVEYIKTDTLSVPVIRDGKVQGYVVSQVSFAVAGAKSGGESADLTPYLVDAAFRAFYELGPLDFTRLKPQDIAVISAKAKAYANERLGSEIVKDVLIGGLNYVGRGEVRTNWVKKTP
jgi:hypothetical protein